MGSKQTVLIRYSSWILQFFGSNVIKVLSMYINQEERSYTCEPLGDLRYLFRTTSECHSNEHPQNLVSGDKISQDSSKEPTQLVLQNRQEIDLLIPE